MSNTSDEKTLKVMKNFAEKYAKQTGTVFCSDLSVTATVIEGLAQHKEQLGAPLCPCRHYEDKEAEAKNAFWNCPCVPMRERNECHCMLFLTTDNPFAGDKTDIDMEYLKQHQQEMSH
jgi:ferredoxin-thioredoxin reductase catalytic chain